ncbi:MAG: DUF99 family protein [Candidatus Woesearchaeota archaeon]
MAMKKEIRLLGIDDAPFDKFSKKRDTFVVVTLFRGGSFMDGVLTTKVRVDGYDATRKIVKVVKMTKFRPQVKCILLDGIALGGFNIIDIQKLHNNTGIPVIVVMRRLPNLETIKKTLLKLGMKKKIHLIEKAGPIYPAGRVYVQVAGISPDAAREVISISSTHSFIPEPIRVAHLIGQGLVFGESKGRA